MHDIKKQSKNSIKVYGIDVSRYAKSKAMGDNIVLENNSSALVLRTNFFGIGPSNKLSFSLLQAPIVYYSS